MKQRKVPLRMCVGCRERFPKKELVRIVHTPTGEVVIDTTGRTAGRGAYICPHSPECLKKAVKSNALGRAFETKISEELIASLNERLAEYVDTAD